MPRAKRRKVFEISRTRDMRCSLMVEEGRINDTGGNRTLVCPAPPPNRTCGFPASGSPVATVPSPLSPEFHSDAGQKFSEHSQEYPPRLLIFRRTTLGFVLSQGSFGRTVLTRGAIDRACLMGLACPSGFASCRHQLRRRLHREHQLRAAVAPKSAFLIREL
jgi:hypothetical protein